MTSDRFLEIHSSEFRAMSERVLEVTALTSRLNLLPFALVAGPKATARREW